MKGLSLSRRDDLESVFYTLLDLVGITIFEVSKFKLSSKNLDLSAFKFIPDKTQKMYLGSLLQAKKEICP